MAAHRYWRIAVNQNNGSTQFVSLAELEMRIVAGGANQCTGGTAFASTVTAGWEAAKAFDGIKNQDAGWACASNHVASASVGYDFGSGNAKDIVEIAVTSRQINLDQQPSVFTLEASDNGLDWRPKSIFGPVSWTSNQTQTFAVDPLFEAEGELAATNGLHATINPPTLHRAFSGYNGNGVFAGRVMVEGTPVEGARLRAYDETTGQLVKETFSNNLGEYTFTQLNEGREYTIVCKSADISWEQTVLSRRAPSADLNMRFRNQHTGEAVRMGTIASGDPHIASVVSHLRMNGSNGSTTFTDERGKVWTPAGNAQISTSVFRFDGASALFDGTGDWIDGPSSSDFTFGTGDFTLECWARFTSSATNRGIISFGSNWTIYLGSSMTFYVFNGTSNILNGGTWTLNTWDHIAVSRAAGTIRLFRNGTLLDAQPNTEDLTSSNMRIGAGADGNSNMLGNIDEVRLTKGIGRYTAAFTPLTEPFSNF